MNRDVLIEAWISEERQPFSGWDFSHLDGRMLEDQPPWSYSSRVSELMRRASSAVDLGTGGGERLLKLRASWPRRMLATENYPPNVGLAGERLGSAGALVVETPVTDGDPMPFSSGAFDLVLNRHAAFNAEEVARILAPGGSFLTQQVHGLWAQDLLSVFGAKPQWPDATLVKYVPELSAAGLSIVETRDWSGQIAFTDVGAVVYYLKAVPWLVPGFSVALHSEPLFSLQARLDGGESLSFVARKYLIEAHKPVQ